jgi:hypothetical protein
MVSVASVVMKLSVAMLELDSTQPFSGIHAERIWEGGQISPKDRNVARFHYLPARFLTPKQVHMRSQVHLQKKRPKLPWIRNPTFVIHTVVASTGMILFVFQMATLVLPSTLFPKDEPNEGVQDWTYTRSINNSDAQATAK